MSDTQDPEVAALPPTADTQAAGTTPGGAEAPTGPGGRPDEDPDTVRAQRDDYCDLLLRKTAEFDNFRKRTERERRDLHERAAADLIADILPLLDDLERASRAEAGDAAVEAYRLGVELIGRRLADVLARRGVVPIDPLGEDFDPHVHEAVVRVQSAAHRDGEVVEVLGKGYRLGDRLLRPAIVKVATE
jgi:molecular chaperone GrpE